MAFCPNCGRKIEDETKGCPVCDAKPETNNQANDPMTSNFNNFNVASKPKAAGNKNLGVIIAAAVALVLIIVLIVSVAGGKPYEKAIDNYFDIAFSGKLDNLKNMAPEAYWEYMEEEYDVDVDDMIDELEDGIEDLVEMMEDEYGKNIKVSYKITDAERFDEDDLKDVKEEMKDNYDISKKSVTDAYELELETKIKGSEDDDEDEVEMYVVKIDGKWYCMTEYYDFMVPGA